MARLRFTTALEVWEALPAIAEDIRAAPSREAPLPFIERLLASETPEDAVTFTAYVLGRREAVWWGCQCLKGLLGADGAAARGFGLAEDWVRDPAEERRKAALAFGLQADKALPTTWLALGAGWSGGNMSPYPDAPVPSLPFLTARSIRTAILVALAKVPTPDRAGRLKACIDLGRGLMVEA